MVSSRFRLVELKGNPVRIGSSSRCCMPYDHASGPCRGSMHPIDSVTIEKGNQDKGKPEDLPYSRMHPGLRDKGNG